MYRKSSLCSSTHNYTALKDFNIIDALKGLQATQKSHVEFTNRQALVSEERHTNLMQELHEVTGAMTLMAEKFKTLVNHVTLQPDGGPMDQSLLNTNMPDFSYLVNPTDPSFQVV